jgi:hypothetical protein
MPMAKNYVIEIVPLRGFEKEAKRLLTPEGLSGLMMHLARDPEAGAVIRQTNGVRKLRWGKEGCGKRGGVRIVYYYRDLNMPLYLLAMYAKREKIDLSAKERKALCGLVDELVSRHGKMTWDNIVRVQIGATGA